MVNSYSGIVLSAKAHRLLLQLVEENPRLKNILESSDKLENALQEVRSWILEYTKNSSIADKYYKKNKTTRKDFETLKWRDFAAIRILDYIDHAGSEYYDLNLADGKARSHPFEILWLGYKYGTGGANAYFYEDMIQLFRQFSGKLKQNIPSKARIKKWMKRYPSGLDDDIIEHRNKNKDRIIKVLIRIIDENTSKQNTKYVFPKDASYEEKYKILDQWWYDSSFHLKFAVDSPELLNEMLGYSLDKANLDILIEAKKSGIPFFVNPYYLSLINTQATTNAIGSDLAIRDYVIYNKKLIKEFGNIVAWEKEDVVKPGEPNAAGWLLPYDHNIHRRYPEVAILIPDTAGRACGGLCVSCQRMYDFQKGNLNFHLEKLLPKAGWKDKLENLMKYFENDSKLRDILITGGDAFMNSDRSLKQILDSVYEMAKRKTEANKNRPDGEKYAEMLRVRLGTRLPAYLPLRVTEELTNILADFKIKASKIGIKQFVVQTHIESPMEITPESKLAIERLIGAGWTVTNQLVFTVAASRRGHTARLREVLNDLGVLTYYTFSVKGFQENTHNFATNARAVQEQLEEKYIGQIPQKYHKRIQKFPQNAENNVENIKLLRKEANLPFLATDRNVLNLPGVGKSLTFRVIGITRYGRRILEFDHDATRNHSPVVDTKSKVIVVESKAIGEYLRQLDAMGENIMEYEALYGYSIGNTEPREPVYEYPEYEFNVTEHYTNI